MDVVEPTEQGGGETWPADEIPFAGLRRNAPALLGGALLLLALWLLPDLTPIPANPPPEELLHGRITMILPSSGDTTTVDARVLILDGLHRGETVDAHLEGPSGAQDLPDYAVGQEVVVSRTLGAEDPYVSVTDRWRMPALVAVLAAFAVAVTVVGGWRGVRSILALVLTLGVVARIIVPLLLAGWSPIPLAIGAATAVTLATLLLTEGRRATTWAAAAGTFLALALTGVLAAVANAIASFTSLQGDEALTFLQSMGRGDLDVRGLLLAAIILGALGVLDDITVTQAATVHELAEADPTASRRTLISKAMNVGRSHIAATVNTLVLAYVGASLPLLVLFAAGRADPIILANGEIVAVEIVRSLVGSIGIVAAVPITTVIAAWVVRPGSPLARPRLRLPGRRRKATAPPSG